MPWRRLAVPVTVTISLTTILVVLITTGDLLTRGLYALSAQPPGVGTAVIAPADSKAAIARDGLGSGREADAAAYLAAQPTAYWLTPEQDPIGEAGRTVSRLIDQAQGEDRALALVIYGLPDRDCGNHSAGGLSEADYPRWTGEIGRALEAAPGLQKIVVLEPDSLALAAECGDITDRARHLSAAVDRLTSTRTWIYLDGGHSGWLGVDRMAGLLEGTGLLPRVRGVATNVSNFRSTEDEFRYAHELSARLGGTHTVIDTSRNGAASAGDQWCNPSRQTVGAPSGTFGDEVVDTNLWIKPPGESDGACNGGPDAGMWWPEGAVELTRDAR